MELSHVLSGSFNCGFPALTLSLSVWRGKGTIVSLSVSGLQDGRLNLDSNREPSHHPEILI